MAATLRPRLRTGRSAEPAKRAERRGHPTDRLGSSRTPGYSGPVSWRGLAMMADMRTALQGQALERSAGVAYLHGRFNWSVHGTQRFCAGSVAAMLAIMLVCAPMKLAAPTSGEADAMCRWMSRPQLRDVGRAPSPDRTSLFPGGVR